MKLLLGSMNAFLLEKTKWHTLQQIDREGENDATDVPKQESQGFCAENMMKDCWTLLE